MVLLKPPPSWKAAASPARTCIEAVPISLADGPTVLRSIIAMAEGLFDTSRCLSISIKYLLKEAGIIAVLWRPRAYGRVGALFPPRLRYVPKLRIWQGAPKLPRKTPLLLSFSLSVDGLFRIEAGHIVVARQDVRKLGLGLARSEVIA